jgi:Ca2+-binding RTX toxin-like protein
VTGARLRRTGRVLGLVAATLVVVAGPAAARVVEGTDGNDHLDGKHSADVMRARAGDDLVHAFPGHDRVYGGAGRDALYGGPGDDVLRGGGGRDHLSANEGNDVIHAGGIDYVDAGRNRDHVVVRRARRGMEIHCAEGRDRLTFHGSHRGVEVIGCEKVVTRR